MTNKKTSLIPDPSELRDDILKKYPGKVAKKRAKSMIIHEPGTDQEIQSNVRTVPGIITQRGCTYAGCKGVVLGPTRDIVNIVHGPIGCSFYAWLTRRNQTAPPTEKDENFMNYAFSTDMQDSNIVFGGEQKLTLAIREAYELFKPKSIAIFSTCPVGLIGDDVHAVAREMKKELGINIFGFSCEGYKGVSQSAGHHIANNGIFKHVVGLDDTRQKGDYLINLLGEYNIGGDGFEIERLTSECGFTTVSTYSGNSSIDHFANSHTADLNLVMCHRSINYIAEMMETKYGIPWIKINFIGAQATAKALRKTAEYFEDEKLTKKVEAIIKREMAEVDKVLKEIKPRTEGKSVMLFVGGSRAHHYQELFRELGMNIVSAGYEFAHRDDYEGRKVLPNIKVDADSRNIEELHVTADEEKYNLRKSEEWMKEKDEEGYLRNYEGMMPEMEEKSLIIDDISHYETEKLIEFYKPAVVCAGIKEKYSIQKMGVPLKQLHSYDYGGPYAAFKGAINFYKEIDRMVNSKVWGYVQPPWHNEPELVARFADEVYQ